jgi:hypothetical protein
VKAGRLLRRPADLADGRAAEAIPLLEQVIADFEPILGPDISTLWTAASAPSASITLRHWPGATTSPLPTGTPARLRQRSTCTSEPWPDASALSALTTRTSTKAAAASPPPIRTQAGPPKPSPYTSSPFPTASTNSAPTTPTSLSRGATSPALARLRAGISPPAAKHSGQSAADDRVLDRLDDPGVSRGQRLRASSRRSGRQPGSPECLSLPRPNGCSARGRGKQALASLTSLPLAGYASIAAARRFHAAARIAHCERS